MRCRVRKLVGTRDITTSVDILDGCAKVLIRLNDAIETQLDTKLVEILEPVGVGFANHGNNESIKLNFDDRFILSFTMNRLDVALSAANLDGLAVGQNANVVLRRKVLFHELNNVTVLTPHNLSQP